MPIDKEMGTAGSTPLAQDSLDATHVCAGFQGMSGYRTGAPGTDGFHFDPGSVASGSSAAEPNPPEPTAARLALPVDDDLSAAMRALEETLLALIDLVADARPAADTAGRLAVSVDPDRGEAVQPAVGPTEVVPLAFPTVSRADVDQLVAGSSRVLAPDVADDVANTLADKAAAANAQTAAAARDDVARFRTEMAGVLALIQVDHSDDFDALARLCRPPSSCQRGSEKSSQEKWC